MFNQEEWHILPNHMHDCKPGTFFFFFFLNDNLIMTPHDNIHDKHVAVVILPTLPASTWVKEYIKQIKVTLGFGLYTDVNGSPFFYTVFLFDQVSP